MALFESYERRIDKVNAVLAEYGIASVEEARQICQDKGFDRSLYHDARYPADRV